MLLLYNKNVMKKVLQRFTQLYKNPDKKWGIAVIAVVFDDQGLVIDSSRNLPTKHRNDENNNTKVEIETHCEFILSKRNYSESAKGKYSIIINLPPCKRCVDELTEQFSSFYKKIYYIYSNNRMDYKLKYAKQKGLIITKLEKTDLSTYTERQLFEKVLRQIKSTWSMLDKKREKRNKSV